MHQYQKKLAKLPPVLSEEQMKQQRMHDVQILLKDLAIREEVTIKLIFDCLYDVGAVNLVNQKLHQEMLNKVGKSAAKLSKPAVKIVAWRWFKKNSPELITNWLSKKVAFGAVKKKQVPQLQPMQSVTPEVLEVPLNSWLEAEKSQREVQQLRARVKLLREMLVFAIITVGTLGGGMVWIYKQIYPFPLLPQVQITPESEVHGKVD